MVAGAAAASRAPADAVTPTSASRRVKVFPMGAVIADGPIRCCGKTRLSGPSLVASYRQILGDQAGAVSHKAVSGGFWLASPLLTARLIGLASLLPAPCVTGISPHLRAVPKVARDRKS